jgi:hypothetical protein
MVKTLGLHPGGTGSNPVKVTKRVGEMVSYMAHDQKLVVQFDYSLKNKKIITTSSMQYVIQD